MFRTEDTIVAVSTAAGIAARAIVRLSGPRAAALAGGVFRSGGPGLVELGGFRAVAGVVELAANGIELPARAYRFRAPLSYTRQDMVELHLPGGGAGVGALLDSLIASGARKAEAGEFTARAFFSGRIDLSQAEAVADIIAAGNDAQLRASMTVLDGEVHRLCSAGAQEIAEALATVEASIDLAEEHIELDSPTRVAKRLRAQANHLRRVAETATDLPEAMELPLVVIAGRPNVGKSSLLNALAGSDRAITSALAGTTRDVLSATITLPGGATVNLLDVAGFAQPADSLAMAAKRAGRDAVARADMILFVVDAKTGWTQADDELLEYIRSVNAAAPILQLENKIDLVGENNAERQADDENHVLTKTLVTKVENDSSKKTAEIKTGCDSSIKTPETKAGCDSSVKTLGTKVECDSSIKTPETKVGCSSSIKKLVTKQENDSSKKTAKIKVGCDSLIKTSAVTGEGLGTVRRELTETLHLSTVRSGSALGLHDRQRRCLQAAAAAAGHAAELLSGANEIADVAELAAVELRDALAQLGALSGEIVTEDILGRIFARFCVGK